MKEANPTSPKPWPVDEVDRVKEANPTSPKPSPVDEVDRVKEANPTSPKPWPVDEVDRVKEANPTSPKPWPVDEIDRVEEAHPTSPKPLPVVEQPNPTSPNPLQSATSAENVDVTPHVIISPSPPKYDPINVWLPSLDLYIRDKAILQSTGWLNDGIILAAQKLLEAQTRSKVFGWQSTQLSKRKGLFFVVPRCSPFVQILHVGKCHWLTTSNVNVHGGASYIDTVCIYDSGRPTTVSTDVTTSVCSFYKCLGERVRFDMFHPRQTHMTVGFMLLRMQRSWPMVLTLLLAIGMLGRCEGTCSNVWSLVY